MSRVNAHVQQGQATLKREVDDALSEGYDASPNARAEFCRIFYRDYSPTKRAYIMGHMLAEFERERATQEAIVNNNRL